MPLWVKTQHSEVLWIYVPGMVQNVGGAPQTALVL
jgi:hypothetical protein